MTFTLALQLGDAYSPFASGRKEEVFDNLTDAVEAAKAAEARFEAGEEVEWFLHLPDGRVLEDVEDLAGLK